MNLNTLVGILLARKWAIIATSLAVLAAALLLTLLTPKSYTAMTDLLIDNRGLDPVSGQAQPGRITGGYLATQTEIITSRRVSRNVVEKLNLASSPVVRKQFQDDTEGQGDVQDWLTQSARAAELQRASAPAPAPAARR